nr:hypothetical protein [Anaerolineae bacterium]
MEVQLTTYPVEMYTASYRYDGEFTPRGNPVVFLNDQSVTTFAIRNVSVIPLMAGARLGEMTLPEVFVPKAQIQVILIGDFGPQEAALRPKPIRLVCFTETYAIRATFHVGHETNAGDVFSTPGPFLPATEAAIFSIRSLTHEINGEAELLYVHKDAVRLFHPE